jgi:hypothetical protein
MGYGYGYKVLLVAADKAQRLVKRAELANIEIKMDRYRRYRYTCDAAWAFDLIEESLVSVNRQFPLPFELAKH